MIISKFLPMPKINRRLPFSIVFLFLCCNAVFAAAVKVNSTTAHSQTMPDVASRGSDVAVVWQSDANYHLEITAAASSDGGRTFGDDVSIAGKEGEIHREPAVAWGPGGELYVAWQANTDNLDYDVLVSVSNDKGRTFSLPVRVGSHKVGNQLFPAIAVAPDGRLHVAWHDNRDAPGFYHIYTAYSEDGGRTFTPGMRVSGEADRLNLWPSIWAGENRVAIAWQGNAAGGFEIFTAVSSDGGDTFSSPSSPPDRGDRDRQFPSVSESGGNLQVVWSENFKIRPPGSDRMYRHPRAQSDILFSQVKEETGFSSPVRINGQETGQQLRPDVLPTGTGGSVIAWFDGRSIADFDIYVASGINGRFEPERRINETEHSDSRNPRIAISGDSLVIVWQDDVEGNYEIYSSRVPLDNLR
ncbi:MAG: sialidase family protein [bacterium]